MKKICQFLYVIVALLIIGFIIRIGVDYYKYDTVNNSAPFYSLIIERTIEFLIPSVILFIVTKIVKKKYAK